MFSDVWMNSRYLDPKQLLAEKCTAHAHTYVYIYMYIYIYIDI